MGTALAAPAVSPQLAQIGCSGMVPQVPAMPGQTETIMATAPAYTMMGMAAPMTQAMPPMTPARSAHGKNSTVTSPCVMTPEPDALPSMWRPDGIQQPQIHV